MQHLPRGVHCKLLRAREFDCWFTVLRAHDIAGPRKGQCLFSVRRCTHRDVFLFWTSFFSCARARSRRGLELAMFLFRAQESHWSPAQAPLPAWHEPGPVTLHGPWYADTSACPGSRPGVREVVHPVLAWDPRQATRRAKRAGANGVFGLAK